MVISLSGRQGSGKTLLANEVVKRGFSKMSFADKLRELVSEIYNIPIDFLIDPIIKNKNLEKPLVWNKKYTSILEKMVGFDGLNHENKLLHSYREAMQFIGTGVLRAFDNDFHVKETDKRISSKDNFVFDDVRFINELNLLKSKNAFCIYIVRPYNFKYSNHISEVQLCRSDFEYIILNNKPKHSLLKEFNIFLDRIEDNLVDIATNRKECGFQQPCENDYNTNAFLHPNKQNSYWAGFISNKGQIERHSKYNYSLKVKSNNLELVKGFRNFLKSNENIQEDKAYNFVINCPFIIDDLKRWNIDPTKSKCSDPPDCVKNDSKLLKSWREGFNTY